MSGDCYPHKCCGEIPHYISSFDFGFIQNCRHRHWFRAILSEIITGHRTSDPRLSLPQSWGITVKSRSIRRGHSHSCEISQSTQDRGGSTNSQSKAFRPPRYVDSETVDAQMAFLLLRCSKAAAKIGNSDFWRCTSLNEILFSPSTHLWEIYESRECTSLCQIEIALSVQIIGYVGFWEWTPVNQIVLSHHRRARHFVESKFLDELRRLEVVVWMNAYSFMWLAFEQDVEWEWMKDFASSTYSLFRKMKMIMIMWKRVEVWLILRLKGDELRSFNLPNCLKYVFFW
jgi:hypothetical protein